jgi:hypothetical protein
MGWQVPVLAVELTPKPWWLRRLLIASSPCGLGFFHEVGAKLLVEIRPEGGRRHNNPLKALPSSVGNAAEGPPRRRAESFVTFATFANLSTTTF